MRLHRLALTAIGPFGGEEVVDFTAFEDSGLFLLEGPTGAGKSTIIDAISFALYGDVARQSDASKDRLRSNRAPASAKSEVDLVFETGAGVFRVRRTPVYVPKGRKSPRASQATLVRVVEDPSAPDGYRDLEALVSGARQVGPEVKRLLGLSKEQFLQTVVLPQGKFADFLTATSQDREAVLRDIFDTSCYLDFQKRIVARGSASRTAVEAAEAECARAFTALEGLAPDPHDASCPDAGEPLDRTSEERPPADPSPIDPLAKGSAALERADAVVGAARAALAACEEGVPGLVEAAERAAGALATAREDRRLVEERERLLAEAAALDARSHEIDADRARLAEARLAARIVPALDSRDASARALAQARSTALEALEGLPETGIDRPESPEALDSVRARAIRPRLKTDIESLQERRSRIRALVETEAGLAKRRAELASVEERAEDLARRSTELARGLKSIPAALEAAEAGRARMAADLTALEGAEAALERIEARHRAAEEAVALIDELTRRSGALSRAAEAARDAGLAAALGHDRWLNQTGAALAADLEEGAPCPVCGSVEHPSLAVSNDGEPLTREAIEALDAAKAAADDALASVRLAHATATQALKSANARAGGDLASVEIELAQARAAVEEAARLKGSIARLDSDLASVRDQERSDREELARLGADAAAARATATALARDIEEDAAACSKAAGDASSLAALDESLTDAIASLSRADAALEGVLHAEGAFSQSADAAARVLGDAEVEDGSERAELLRSRRLPKDRVLELERSVSDYDARRGAVRQILASPKIVRAQGLLPAEEAPLVAALEEAKRARDTAQRRQGALSSALDLAEAARETFVASMRALADARRAAGPVRRLAGIADATSRDNLVATPLSAWVLVSRLDEVLAAANPRLLTISSGRYELVSCPDDGTSSRKSGLGLLVVDHDTEETRSTKTLSGGETFYASLALALGLADVVTAEAGGVELRTMFIDEGFGSLDASTLELVMAQLHALRDSGRTVGVISHVEEMARQIPDQIRVRPNGPKGSMLSVRA